MYEYFTDGLKLTENEKKFVEAALTAVTKQTNQIRIISDFYLIKNLKKLSDKTIISNEKLSGSNEKYAKGMLCLTGGLVFVGLVQIMLMIVKLFTT